MADKTYNVVVQRLETWTDTVQVVAASASEATLKVQAELDADGWEGVFVGEDGDYEECVSTVRSVTEVVSNRKSKKTQRSGKSHRGSGGRAGDI